MRKKIGLKLVFSLFVLALVGGGIWWFWGRRNNTNPSVEAARATVDEIEIKRSFTLPGLNPQNTTQQKGLIEMTVTKARKLNRVLVKGESVEAPAGKVFLALDLELKNSMSEALGFFARDYFRWIKGSDPYSPQFYNRGVGVAPVSVKKDRVAFVVDAKDKNFNIQVGELNKNNQQLLELKFNK